MFVVVFLAGFITAVDKQLSTQIKMNRLAENMAKQMFYIKQVDEITDYSEKLKEYKDKFKENISEMKDTLPESNLIKDDYIFYLCIFYLHIFPFSFFYFYERMFSFHLIGCFL